MQRALRPVEDALWHWNEVARREQTRNQAQAAALIPVIVQQVTENVIAQIDFVRVVEQIPVDDIAGAIDVEAIVQRIDLGGVIRESTMGLTTRGGRRGALAGRSRSTSAPARVVDTVLFRKQPRDVDDRDEPSRLKGEIRNERSRDAQGQRAGFVSQASLAGARRGRDLRHRLRRAARLRRSCDSLVTRRTVRDAATRPGLATRR